MNDGPPHKAADEWRGWAVVDLAQALPAGDAADGREEGLSSGIRLRRGGLLRDPAIELSLRDRRSLGPLGHCQGEAMVPSGDPTFDLAFCVVTTDPERCAALLQVSSLREALLRARGDAGLLELAWADGDARLTFSAPLEGGSPDAQGADLAAAADAVAHALTAALEGAVTHPAFAAPRPGRRGRALAVRRDLSGTHGTLFVLLGAPLFCGAAFGGAQAAEAWASTDLSWGLSLALATASLVLLYRVLQHAQYGARSPEPPSPRAAGLRAAEPG